MKKLFLMLAFTGMVTAVSASTVSALSNNTSVSIVIGDDKKGDDKKSHPRHLKNHHLRWFFSLPQ